MRMSTRFTKLSREESKLLSEIGHVGLRKFAFPLYSLSCYSVYDLQKTVKILPRLQELGFLSYSEEITIAFGEGHDDGRYLPMVFFDLIHDGKIEKALQVAQGLESELLVKLVKNEAKLSDILVLSDTGVGMLLYDELYPNLCLTIEMKKAGLEWLAANPFEVHDAHYPPKEKGPNPAPYYDAENARLWTGGQFVQFAKTSKQHEALRVIWTDPSREWQYDEIYEQIDSSADKYKWKILYDRFKEIQRKVALKTGISNFFRITTQSVKVCGPEVDTEDPAVWA